MSNGLKEIAALTALNDMMAKGYVNICTIDAIGVMLGLNPKCEAYRILQPLHCVDFDKMPCDLVAAIPGLIQQCLNIEPTFQFKSLAQPLIDVAPETAQKGGVIRRLFRG